MSTSFVLGAAAGGVACGRSKLTPPACLEQLFAEQHVVRVGIEGSGNYGRAVAAHLVIAGALEVVEVPRR